MQTYLIKMGICKDHVGPRTGKRSVENQESDGLTSSGRRPVDIGTESNVQRILEDTLKKMIKINHCKVT